MTISKWLPLLALVPATSLAATAPPTLTDYVAHCDVDGREVWRMSLCAPLIVVAQD